jgi:spermidine dehydrogenase
MIFMKVECQRDYEQHGPELPQAQREALAKNAKTALVYTNVVVRNWRSWLGHKTSEISAPMCFFSHVALDFPV